MSTYVDPHLYSCWRCDCGAFVVHRQRCPACGGPNPWPAHIIDGPLALIAEGYGRAAAAEFGALVRTLLRLEALVRTRSYPDPGGFGAWVGKPVELLCESCRHWCLNEEEARQIVLAEIEYLLREAVPGE